MSNSLINNLAGLGTIALMVTVFTVENLLVKFIAGIILLAVMIISLIIIQKNKELTSAQKKLAWVVVLPLFSLIGYLLQQV